MRDLFGKTIVVNVGYSQYDVYCGRAGRGEQGLWGNPHPASRVCQLCSASHGRDVWHTKAESIALFREYFLDRVASDQDFRERTLSLKGKALGCFCVNRDGSGDCHAKVIAEWVDRQT